MQRYVKPVFREDASPVQAPDKRTPSRRSGGVRWWAVFAAAAVTLLIALASYLLTGALLSAREESSRLLAVVMALLAGAAALGVIGLAHQLTGFLTYERAPEIPSEAFFTVEPDGTPPSDLASSLRRQREETAHLLAVLESIPEGVVVQDLEGRVLLINDAARQLLGSQRAFRAARLHELTEAIRKTLGPALAPGIYALGNPARIPFEGRCCRRRRQRCSAGKECGWARSSDTRRDRRRGARARRAELLDQLSMRSPRPARPSTTRHWTIWRAR